MLALVNHRPTLLALLLLIALLGGGFGDAMAAAPPPPLHLTGDADRFGLRGHLAILKDADGDLGIGDVVRSDAFQTRPPDAMERNYTNGAIWYRFGVLRGSALPADWVLAIGEPFIDDIRVYVSRGEGFDEHQLGRRIPNGQLPMAARHHVVELALAESVPTTIYVRLASHDEIQFEAALWRPHALMFVEVRTSTLLGMFFAALTFVVLIYLLFGIALRDRPMVGYSFYIATFVLFGSSHTGIMAILFPSWEGPFINLLTGIGVLGNVAALTFMWDGVLNLRKSYPAVHRIYMLVCAAAVISFLAIPTSWYILFVKPTFVATMLVTVASLWLAGAHLRAGRGTYLIKYYIAAFIPFLLFSIAHAAEAFFPSRIDILLVRQFGTLTMLAHIIILSVALAHRIARIQRERVRADTELLASRSAIREHRNFVSMLSHQIRNPLGIITAVVEVMDRRQGPSKDTATIRRAARRMRDLADDLLADSRLEEMAVAMTVQPVDLAALLNRLCEERRDTAPQRLECHCRDVAIVPGDPTLLGVLFANLLDNALKYSAPGGSIRVTVTGGHRGTVVAVSDDGPGIPASESERVFEKYYRSSLTSGQPGTGLGLFLVRQIAERHGGSVSLRSAPGEGAEFTVRLPARLPEAVAGPALVPG